MLSRLLKYDLRAVLKYWWIAALTSVALSVVGGTCIVILDNDYTQNLLFEVTAGLGLFLAAIALMAFVLLSEILVYVRFYNNFFSDEGYLTFTLPVKRSHLLSSKVITATLVSVMTGVVLVTDIVIMVAMALGDRLFTQQFWERFWSILEEVWSHLGGYFIVYILQLMLMLLVMTVFSTMLLFCCITLASIIVKKHKIIAAIAISYAASGVISFITQWVFLFGIYGVDAWLAPLSVATLKAVIALILATLTLFVAAAAMGLYAVNHWMLDRRLNLS